MANIKLPDNIDLLTANAIKKGEEYKNNKAVHRRILATAASICLVFTIGITSLCVAAEAFEFGGNVFKEIKELVGLRGGSQGTELINKTTTKNGVSLTLQDVICDEYGVYVSFIVKSKKPFINTNDSQLLLNDNYARTSFHKGNLDTGGIAGLEGKFIDENTFIGVETYLFTDLKTKVPENFTLNIKIGAIPLNSVEDNSIIRGNWKFSVPVELNGDGVKVITPSIRNNNISIKKVTLSKLNTFIEVELPISLREERVTLITDKGVLIDTISTTTEENNGKIMVGQRFKGIPDDTDSLILSFGDTESITINIR
ncbi:DUF4179 domain-containing protein [Clostridium sp. MSJ-11]|uniref:DUF4179 domain-containing protein n=1 Tax=Clostridium mobile TaxID=2841512 RepID=A0ABS6EKU7_9CLOT|nr:DUF4179 domain-containing protein [Clostridium mobile]